VRTRGTWPSTPSSTSWVPPGDLGALQEALTEGYLQGLANTIAPDDVDLVRRAILAAGAVKYFWVPLAMVDAVEQRRATLNRRPLEEAFATWASVVPHIFEAAHRWRSTP
jgi:hypothetical protein